MKKAFLLLAVAVFTVGLAGCGGGDNRSVFVATITSDPAADGDIEFNPVSGVYTSSQASTNGNVLFGLDDSSADRPEFRAFLDFPLDGSTGAEAVPLDAAIVSARVRVLVNSVSFAAQVPTLLDLVSYPVSGPSGSTDFNSAPLDNVSRTLDFLSSDTGRYVEIDVTPHMRRAQVLALNDLQLRFLLDFLPGAAGLVDLDDGPAVSAPLLTVEYTLP